MKKFSLRLMISLVEKGYVISRDEEIPSTFKDLILLKNEISYQVMKKFSLILMINPVEK